MLVHLGGESGCMDPGRVVEVMVVVICVPNNLRLSFPVGSL